MNIELATMVPSVASEPHQRLAQMQSSALSHMETWESQPMLLLSRLGKKFRSARQCPDQEDARS